MSAAHRRAPSLLALSVLLLVGASTTTAQTIGGRVRDRETRLPANGVRVLAYADTSHADSIVGRLVADVRTDSAGVFYVDLAVPGTVRLVFTLGDEPLGGPTQPYAVGAGDFSQHEFLVDIPRAQAYSELQVAHPVRPAPGNRPPRYPDAMRDGNIEGEVLARFIVDTTGLPEMRTFRVLRSTNTDFVAAVREALPSMRFVPASLTNGRKVPQVVQMPFVFSLIPLKRSMQDPNLHPFGAAGPLRP